MVNDLITLCKLIDEDGILPRKSLNTIKKFVRTLNREEAENISQIMQNAIPLSIPNKCDVEVGPSWGEAK